jgi:hypothetical protein
MEVNSVITNGHFLDYFLAMMRECAALLVYFVDWPHPVNRKLLVNY